MSDIIVCDTPDKVEAFHALSIRGRLKMELKGLKFRGGSTFSYVKAKFGLKGSKESVLEQYENLLKSKGILS